VTVPRGDRLETRLAAGNAGPSGGWLDLVVRQHAEIEAAFERARECADPKEQQDLCRQLGVLVNAHADAEECVLYPARALLRTVDDHAAFEQDSLRLYTAEILRTDLTVAQYQLVLGSFYELAAAHMYAEESGWLLQLQARSTGSFQAHLTERYRAEYERICTTRQLEGSTMRREVSNNRRVR
jgi:Hemerythrin HHE cation binding domain